jgi:hypothetical protein
MPRKVFIVFIIFIVFIVLQYCHVFINAITVIVV